ncbi:unnamed protein product [Closterium sp. NIES-53]
MEYGGLQEMARKAGAGGGAAGVRTVVYGTTEMLAGSQFVEQLSELGRKMGYKAPPPPAESVGGAGPQVVPSCPLFFVALPYQKFLYCPLHCRAAALPCPAGYRAALPKPTRCRSVQCARLPTAPHAARNDARSPHAARALPALPTRSPHCLRAALCCPRPPARCLHTARPSSAALRTALHVCLPCPSPPACALPEPAPLHYARACPAPRRLRAPCLSRLRIALPAPCPVLRCCAASSRPVPLPVLPPAAAASPLPCPRYSRPAEPPCQAAQPSRPAKPPSRAALLSRIAQPPLLPPLLLLLLLLLLPLLPLLPPLPLLLSLPLLLLWRLPLCSPLMPRSTRSILSPADRVARSQWSSCNATATLAVRIKRYSSPSSATIGCLALPFLFPELSDFTTVADLMTHLRSLDTRYRAALESDFLAANNPFMYLTLYFLMTRFPDSLRAVRDHFLALDPIKVTLASFETQLLELSPLP